MLKSSLLSISCRHSAVKKLLRTSSSSTIKSDDKREYTVVNEANGIREIILNDTKTRNSLTRGLMDSLRQNLTKDQDCEKLRCIVISANGPCWSSGHNLKELNASQDKNVDFEKLVNIINIIRKHPVPVIAQVNGVTAAAGVQLMACCDIVISGPKSKFSTPGGKLGIFCSTPGIALARAMPRLQASYMLFTGNEISAQEAYDAGLVSKLAKDDNALEEEMCQVTEAILSKSRAVLTLGKQFFYKQMEMGTGSAFDEGVKTMCDNFKLQDCQEGINSFIEKRSPVWKHK